MWLSQKEDLYVFMLLNWVINIFIYTIPRFVLISHLSRAISLCSGSWLKQRLITIPVLTVSEWRCSPTDRTMNTIFHGHPKAQRTSRKRGKKECISLLMEREVENLCLLHMACLLLTWTQNSCGCWNNIFTRSPQVRFLHTGGRTFGGLISSWEVFVS